ncbi:MAG: hypothetical protein AAFN10_27780 [Bacteroidota bacterium]
MLPFVENLFKYGISSQNETSLSLRLSIEEGELTFATVNPISVSKQKGTGTGIEQAKRRLALRYPDRHHLSIRQEEGQFKVYIRLQLDPQPVYSSTQ